MKRLLIVSLLCVLFLPTLASAADAPSPNAKRIAEIQAQQKEIIVQSGTIDVQIANLQQQKTALQTEFTKLQGAIEELQRQDREAAKTPSK